MIEIKRIRELWPHLSKFQTLHIVLRARWLLYSDAYADLPYLLRRRLFVWALYTFTFAHWVR